MACPLCGEQKADARYYRLNPLTEEIQHLCKACWIASRKAESEWDYFKGAGRLLLYYTILPVLATALLAWLLVVVLF